ncbi:fluoride efflux transporter CrcB [Shewanella sp. NIFS-20-20]|uniref:fluoride efflux transporter CrcB n=1 Tax=Shewanella sp. NIFS-20-20 TaxID=2853806 RepID=UPI001C464EF8|nr:fluoride efflux transporter CrcB [Shewanella sp. NIFS-20-20]MBV7316515.1 fluoride efflux transporter CrcB [Shewanella sp. NIFS-20-20]
MTALDVMWVGIGGGIGTVIRWAVGKWVANRFHMNFPIATFGLNITGSFVIAFLSVLFSVHWQSRYGEPLNALILTGILGGYTTFSSMQMDALKYVEAGKVAQAVGYLLLSTVAGFAAAILGIALASL